MNVLLFTLLFVLLNAQYVNTNLNEFSGDVDIYDMGTMGRGKNAASWHRSLSKKQEVFYYLAMQPWRHLVWTDCTEAECYKYIINEDASNIPSGNKPANKLQINSANDYCRKEYAHPMATYDIDWSKVEPSSRLESIDINGVTCFKYPAKLPLAHIYLQQHYTQPSEVGTMTQCRYDFVGGKSITFRSINSFSEVFIGSTQPNGYLYNKTKCYIDPTPNNVDTDLAIVLGISDNNIRQTVNDALQKLKTLQTVKQTTIYYMNGDSIRKEVVSDWSTLKAKQISVGSVDPIINVAKNDLIKRINAKAIYRGTMIVLMDKTLTSTFDAETAFDRNQITVHTIVYNPSGNSQMTQRAQALLSLGEHYHEFTSQASAKTIVDEMFIGVRVNLTERCNRTSCNGFCDGRDRCTCPMCCENTCYFSYCDASTATCKSWPEGAPKEKIHCANDCVGDQVCEDLVGCKYTRYNDGCEPPAKCMKPFCNEKGKCDLKDTCENDLTPSYQNRCWSYSCDTKTGKCVRGKSGDPCPANTDPCKQYECDANLKCLLKDKKCVKTAPYAEMDCYTARCNRNTGQCEDALSCDVYSGCGKTADKSACSCDASSGFKCKCQSNTDGFCRDNEICNGTYEHENNPICVDSKCGQDLYREGCRIKKCDETTGLIYWDEVQCDSKVDFDYIVGSPETPKRAEKSDEDVAREYCQDKFEKYCDNGDCYAREKDGVSMRAGCGECKLGSYRLDGEVKIYKVYYEENCQLTPTCPDGKEIPNYRKYFDDKVAECGTVKGEPKCVFSHLKQGQDVEFDMCSQCFSGAECYKASEYVNYKFNKDTGMCEREILASSPQCSRCNADNDAYERTCVNVFIDKKYTYQETKGQNKKVFAYQIPKICNDDNCIPEPDFNCGQTSHKGYQDRVKTMTPEVKAIFETLKQCYSSVSGSYHYSSLFDYHDYYTNGKKQPTKFFEEMDDEAYCVFTYEAEKCHRCEIQSNNLKDVDECYEESKNLDFILDFVCNDQGKCIVKLPDPPAEKDEESSTATDKTTSESEEKKIICDPINDKCVYQKEEEGKCVDFVKQGVVQTACAFNNSVVENKFSEYRKNPDHMEIKCSYSVPCEKETNSCPLQFSDENCKKAYDEWENGERDFGCYVPIPTCEESTLHCRFKKMQDPSDDIEAVRIRDGVKTKNACYQYTCQQDCYNNECTHKWVQTPESVAKTTKTPASACEEVVCDEKTGEVITSIKECLVSRDFKQIDEAKAECFKCQCSALTGEMVLVMLPDTETQTYELDGCGNCIIRSKETGEQINKPAECILDVPVNLTGAIAGATVAASIVFGLIGSMVVVAVGALQTYQLVSSAMKNVISTTLENPEFVAADNEATNALAAD